MFCAVLFHPFSMSDSLVRGRCCAPFEGKGIFPEKPPWWAVNTALSLQDEHRQTGHIELPCSICALVELPLAPLSLKHWDESRSLSFL